MNRLTPADRVLLVGDVRQHQAVEAGRPYQQLQEAGIATARLEGIVRQRDPALKAIVEHLARGDVRGAIHQLDAQCRVHEIADHDEPLGAIAREYVRRPNDTLVVWRGAQPSDSPSEASRRPSAPAGAPRERDGGAAGGHWR